MSLSGKTVLVTGGGTGIGAACALSLAKEGCRVAIAGRRDDKLRETAARHKGEYAILTHTVDVADRSSVTDLILWATKELGRIDILINSSGTNIPKRAMADLNPDDWDKLIAINATGAYNCLWAVLPQMRDRKDGLVINIVSTAGIRAGLLGGVAYNASKFAMSALGITVAQEVKDQNIRVTNLYPGEVDTPILENRPVPVTPEHRARILQAEDVADAVVMIAKLPARAHVSEITIKPTSQAYC